MKHKNIKLILNYVIGPLVFCILIISIYYQIQNQQDEEDTIEILKSAFNSENLLPFISVIGLMFLNWGIEAKKWQISIKIITPISFIQSFKAIFSGTTVAFFTPNRIGEYIGRMWYVEKSHRLHTIPLTIIGSITQVTVTLFIGFLALLYWKFFSVHEPIEKGLLNVLLWVSILLVCLMILFYSKAKWILDKILSISWLKKANPYFQAVISIDKMVFFQLLVLSFCRYFVFILQYWLIMDIFGIKLSIPIVTGIMATIFFLLAMIPTFGDLMDMSIRLKASVYMVQNITGNITGMLATSLTIWIVNLVIPALIGSLLILTIRIFNDRKQ